MSETDWSNDDNPYAVSPVVAGNTTDFEMSDVNFVIDGDAIRCGPEVRLPDICVRTGDTQDVIRINKAIYYVSPVVYVVLLLSPLIGLILMFALRKKCQVSYCLSSPVRSQMRWYAVAGTLAILGSIGLFVFIIGSGAADRTPFLIGIPILVFIAAIVLLAFGTNALKVQKQVGGKEFWIKGFKDPFLTELRIQFGSAVSSGF